MFYLPTLANVVKHVYQYITVHTPPTGIIFNFNLKNVIVGNHYLADQLILFLLHSCYFLGMDEVAVGRVFWSVRRKGGSFLSEHDGTT